MSDCWGKALVDFSLSISPGDFLVETATVSFPNSVGMFRFIVPISQLTAVHFND